MENGILIIEDEAIIALDIARKIQQLGYPVTGIAADEQEAILLAGKNRPVLALVDIKLKGGSDGIEVARRLQDQFSVPVVLLTAYSDRHVRERAMQLNPAGYLLKPINKAEFDMMIQSVLAHL